MCGYNIEDKFFHKKSISDKQYLDLKARFCFNNIDDLFLLPKFDLERIGESTTKS